MLLKTLIMGAKKLDMVDLWSGCYCCPHLFVLRQDHFDLAVVMNSRSSSFTLCMLGLQACTTCPVWETDIQQSVSMVKMVHMMRYLASLENL